MDDLELLAARIADLSDAALIDVWHALAPTDDGESPEHDAIAGELEKRGIGV